MAGPDGQRAANTGAMVACEVAFQSDEPLAALVVLSGTPVDRAGWRERMSRRQGLPVFMSHGRADNILPFDWPIGCAPKR